MKLLVGAIALAFAMPAAAQSAPAQMDHSAHAQHQTSNGPASSGHTQHGDHQKPQGGSQEGHSMKDGCCADKDGNGKMDCCERMAATKGDQPPAESKGN
ncbi:hypothetical protein ACWPM1_13330 [Tsuneonella sp. HG249]